MLLTRVRVYQSNTAWKVSKYGVVSGPYFPVFGLDTGKYGPEVTPYFDTFHAVKGAVKSLYFKEETKNVAPS